MSRLSHECLPDAVGGKCPVCGQGVYRNAAYGFRNCIFCGWASPEHRAYHNALDDGRAPDFAARIAVAVGAAMRAEMKGA